MQQTVSPFLSREYTSERNILRMACLHHSFYLSKVLGENQGQVYKNLTTYVKENVDLFRSRKATVLIKNKNEDREVKIVPLSSLFNLARKKNYHFSPSMVAYKNSDEEECVNAIGTRLFVKNRGVYKGLRQKALDDKDKDLYNKYDKLQNAFKIFNNAQSGAMSSEGTPINNSTGHTTLTSTCRCLTSTANLINEQFIAGNRFYNSPQNTLQSITARIVSTDLKSLENVMEKYKLYYPTSEDLLNIIKQNSYRYWESVTYMGVIKEYVDTLKPLEIASVVYTLDLISLFRFNKEFMVEFFNKWVGFPKEKIEELKPDNGDKYVLCISKLPKGSPANKINILNSYHNELENSYSDFIKQFLKSPIPPTDLFNVTSSIRDCVLTSDTDSSIYTLDHVIDEFTTSNSKKIRLSGVLTYFIRMISVDQHRQLSVNMNVSAKNQSLLGMKNEFYFSGYVTTLMSKHYYALQRMVEGVMLAEPEMEIKGVHLRSSKIAKSIKNSAKELMEKIINSLETGELLDPAEELFKIAELERLVIKELNEGSWTWLSKQGIKGFNAYAEPMRSAYYYHLLWDKVFAAKYGNPPDLPYVGIKINVDLNNRTKINEYMANLEDQELANRLKSFIDETKRDKFKGFVVPMEILTSLKDIPYEIKKVMDVRTIIKQNFKSIYSVLESAGLYFINSSISRLISDEH